MTKIKDPIMNDHVTAYIERGNGQDELSALPSERHWSWLLWHDRALLFNWVWKAALLAALLAFLIPPRYESTTRLVPGESSSMSASSMSMLAARAMGTSSAGIDLSGLLGTKTPAAFYVSILQSRTVQDKLIDRFDLRKIYGKRYYETARETLASRTKVAEDRKSGVITVTVSDRRADRAKALAQAYAEEVNRLAADLNTSEAHRERIFIEDRLRETKQELDSADKELSEFSSKYSAIDIKEQGKAMVQAAASLQGELIAAQSQLTGLEQIYSDNNVRVRSLRARIQELKRQLEKIGGDYTPPTTLEASKEELYPPIRSLPALGYRYAAYYRRAKVAETVYELLTKQYEISKIQEAKELPVILTMDAAAVPERRSFPPRTLIIVLGVLAGFLLASLWVLAKDYWREVDPADPRKQFVTEVKHDLAPALRWMRLRSRAGARPDSPSLKVDH